ncbi:glycosyltransferase family 4 protein [Chitinophaga barathri]|uniref:glycosyltransferase family 4 protein n=1 Tax=Chitinophaga barathri TaxID=1647451 RepID=UPI001F4EBE07|nr:glycosyltransferase family 4 protein [Chitinophaga barathri]
MQTIRQGLIGGGETHVLSLTGQLDRSRFEPVVLSFTDGPMIDQLREAGVEHYVIPTLKAFDLRQWKKIGSLLAEKNIDIVHAHGSRAASNLFFPARKQKIPLLYTIHGWSFHNDQSLFVKRLRVLSEQFLTANMQRNISVSASNFETGREHFRNFRSTVINNGIDLQKFSPANAYKNIRQKLDIPASHILIGFVARMTAQKDPLTMISGFAKAAAQREDITLLMVGEGELQAEARQLAERLGIAHRIVFQPFRQDVPDLLHATDIYCLPSLWEGMPIGLLEAMAMHNAVIVTNVDGSKEIIRDRENGCMTEAKNEAMLAGTILELAADGTLRNRLATAARATVQEHYSVEFMTRQVEQIYEDVFRTEGKRLISQLSVQS